jgi:RNA polymerase sigma factor (sigma-70 family)
MSGASQSRCPSFDAVYALLFPVIYRVSLRVTGSREAAEDLCHESFLRYLQHAPPLPDVDQAKYWLIRVVKNLSLNHEKRRRRERVAGAKLRQLSVGYSDESGEGMVLRAETRTGVQRALDTLPFTLRAPVVFREYGGLSYREIASVMGITENNVKVRIFRARERLEKALAEEGIHVS